MLLKEAAVWVLRMINEGEAVVCPCCNQFCKIYERKLNSQMAHFLVLMRQYYLDNRLGKRHWINTRALGSAGGHKASTDGTYLTKWGLIEKKAGASGVYRVSDEGIAFLRGQITVPKVASIYNNRALSFSEEHTDIHAALGDKFDLHELLHDHWLDRSAKEGGAPYERTLF